MTANASLDSLTVVIPTYNRADVLRRALAGYLEQSSPNSVHELIVIDDGSSDETRTAVEEIRKKAPFQIRYIYQTNQGPAIARNRGIDEVSRGIILFTDDDIVPHPNLVARHLDLHRENREPNVASLGFVTWSPEVRPTPFMRWYGEEGALFGYNRIGQRRELDFRFFYTCNVSLKREFLLSFGKFDETFDMAAYEDIELGFRLAKAGLKLLYNPTAIAYHYQHFTFSDACLKARRAGKARKRFLETEAGKHEVTRQRERKSGLGFRICELMARFVGAMFPPATRLADSRIPLPGIVYRGLFWYHGVRQEEETGFRT